MAAADQSYCKVQLDAEENYCGEFHKEQDVVQKSDHWQTDFNNRLDDEIQRFVGKYFKLDLQRFRKPFPSPLNQRHFRDLNLNFSDQAN